MFLLFSTALAGIDCRIEKNAAILKSNLKAIFFFSCTDNSSEPQDRGSPASAAGLRDQEAISVYTVMCEGRKARPTPMDLRSIPVEVHAFESHPSHFFSFCKDLVKAPFQIGRDRSHWSMKFLLAIPLSNGCADPSSIGLMIFFPGNIENGIICQ